MIDWSSCAAIERDEVIEPPPPLLPGCRDPDDDEVLALAHCREGRSRRVRRQRLAFAQKLDRGNGRNLTPAPPMRVGFHFRVVSRHRPSAKSRLVRAAPLGKQRYARIERQASDGGLMLLLL
jgi:hypothetical protein